MKNKLNAGQYWEWRTTIEEMQHAATKLDNHRLMFALMDKDIEIQKLRLAAYKEQVRAAETRSEDAKKDYADQKAKLEKALGRSLTGVVIDDVTFEIRDDL